jgi:FG-GAP repeat
MSTRGLQPLRGTISGLWTSGFALCLLLSLSLIPLSHAQWPPVIDLSDDSGPGASSVMRILGDDADDHLGSGLSGGIAFGDINGDGFDDMVVSAPYADTPSGEEAGETCIVYGNAQLSGTSWDLNTDGAISALGETRILGETPRLSEGWAVACGDVDADGFDDVVLGSRCRPYQDHPGVVYVVYGHPDLPGEVIDLSQDPAFPPHRIARFEGSELVDYFGYAVACADVNADGYDDVIVGANASIRLGWARPGSITVLFGGADGAQSWGGTVILGDELENRPGVDDALGFSLASGDVNGDGFDDIIAGALYLHDLYPNYPSKAYVIYGRDAWPQTIDLETDDPISPDNETRLIGWCSSGGAGAGFAGSLASGDINGDGLDDVIIGQLDRWAYVVYGSPTLPGTVWDYNTWSSNKPIWVTQIVTEDNLGHSVAAADLNADGFDDVVLGGYLSDGPEDNRDNAGELAVIWGHPDPQEIEINLREIDPAVRVYGANPGDYFGIGTESGGDLDRDGFVELAAGAFEGDNPTVSEGDNGSGHAVALFGSGTVQSTTVAEAFRPGHAPRRGFGGRLSPVMRAWLSFTGGVGVSGESSWAVATIVRSDAEITGLGDGSLDDVADVLWEITTDRVGFTEAEVTFQYLDSEIEGLQEEAFLLCQAPSAEGPWTLVPLQALDTQRNEIMGWVTELSHFALTTSTIPDAFEVDSLQAPVPVDDGSVLMRSVFPQDDIDWMRIDTAEITRVTAAALGSPTELVIYLFDVTGGAFDLMALDVGRDAVIPLTPIQPGTHIVAVEEWNHTDEVPLYTFSLFTESVTDSYEVDDLAVQARLIEPGTTQSDRTIFPIGDHDWVTFHLSSPAEVAVTAEGEGPEMVLYLIRFDDRGQRILRLDVGQSPSVSARLPPGQYHVMVDDWHSDEVQLGYSLHLETSPLIGDEFEPDDWPTEAHPIANGVVAMDRSISPMGDHDWLTLSTPVTGEITGSVEGAESAMVLYLIRFVDGIQEIIDIDVGPSANVATIASPGVYFLMAEDLGSDQEIPQYRFTITSPGERGDPHEPDNSPAQATLLSPGESQMDHSLSPTGDQDWYSIMLSDQRPLIARAWSSEHVLRMRLVGISDFGMRIITESSGTETRIQELLPPGQWYLQIESGEPGQPIPSYGIEVLPSLPPDPYEPDDLDYRAREFPLGQTQSDRSLHVLGDRDYIWVATPRFTLNVWGAESDLLVEVHSRYDYPFPIWTLVDSAVGTEIEIDLDISNQPPPMLWQHICVMIRDVGDDDLVPQYSLRIAE